MSTPDPQDLVIGRLGSPYGVRGELRVVPETDFPERFACLREVRVELPDGSVHSLRVAHAAIRQQRITLKFEGYDTPEAAARLTGGLLTIRRSEAMPLPEGHYYEHQIVGLEVVDVQGQSLGHITEVMRTGANDIYAAGDLLIPATREVVKEINLEAGRMVVELPPEE